METEAEMVKWCSGKMVQRAKQTNNVIARHETRRVRRNQPVQDNEK